MNDRIKQVLETELASPEFAVFYEYLKFTYPDLQDYPTYSRLISFLHNQNSKDYIKKDNIFKSLIREYQKSYNPNLVCLFFVLFYPGTSRIFLDNVQYFPEEDDLTDLIRGSLFDLIATYDIASKPSKIASKIIGSVRNKVNEEKNKIFSHLNDVDIHIVDIPDGRPAPQGTNFLEILVNKKVITEEEKYIITESRIKEVSLHDLASQLGDKYDAVSKRRQRAEEQIKIFLEEKEKW